MASVLTPESGSAAVESGSAAGESGSAAVESDRVAVELRYLVLAAQREGSRKLSRDLTTIGLTPAQAEVLTVLSEREPLTLVDLGRFIVCESGSPSRIVDALVRRGLVTREPGRSDRRVVLLELSGAGRELLPKLHQIDESITAMTSGRLSPDERELLATALRKVIAGTAGGQAVARRFAGE